MSASAPLRLMIRLLSNPPDLTVVNDPESWNIIKTESGRHGLRPLLAFAARKHLPASERHWCDQVLTRAWQRHNENLASLDYVLGILEAEGIRALALKGPCLALRYYEPAFLRRPSFDLDVAVTSADFARACHALERVGYSQLVGVEETLEFSHHAVLMHKERPRVEIHFRLTHGARGLGVDEFLSRALPYQLPGGRQVWIPSPADELLHLALHVAAGRFAPFFHLYELHRISALMPREHVEQAARRAAKEHFVGAFYLIDAAFRLHWDEPFLPAGLDLRQPWLHWRLNENLYWAYQKWSELGGEHTLASRLRGRWLDLQTSDGPSDAWRQLQLLGRYAGQQMWKKGWRNVPIGGVRPR
ncbi:MAG: nucleotidyltransferase family protein [Acidobacteriota bacterium]|nr:nucleotidyltransferase family protein [Acidobacteriota bacterium]